MIPWDHVESWLEDKYAVDGRPAKPVRLMVWLLLLKRLYNRCDGTVVEESVHNPYMQYFSGETELQWDLSCEPSDVVHFRNRIGEEGVKKILTLSIDLHGKDAQEAQVVIDTTVQEKNTAETDESALTPPKSHPPFGGTSIVPCLTLISAPGMM